MEVALLYDVTRLNGVHDPLLEGCHRFESGCGPLPSGSPLLRSVRHNYANTLFSTNSGRISARRQLAQAIVLASKRGSARNSGDFASSAVTVFSSMCCPPRN